MDPMEMTDEQIASELAALGDQKREIKARERMLTAVVEVRGALKNVSEAGRRIVTIQLGGLAGADGKSAAKKVH